MKTISPLYLLLVLAFLLVSAPRLHSQAGAEAPSPVSGLLKIKTNPLQYMFRRANISLEVDLKPQTSVELKGEVFPGIPSLYNGIISVFPVHGGGFGGHLMVRRYNAQHHWFGGGGLSLKRWSYDSLRFYPETFTSDYALRCTAQSQSAWVPGLKAIGGIQYNVPRAPFTIEAFVGLGVKFRIARKEVHLLGIEDLGPNFTSCVVQNTSFATTENSFVILGAIYFGGNIGFDMMRPKK